MPLTKDDYKQAITVQDACNLSGVVNSFSALMKRLSEDGLDTAAKNRHPIAIMYASKIAALTGCEHIETFSEAYDKCVERSRPDDWNNNESCDFNRCGCHDIDGNPI